jgi:hypothetical protein
LDRNSAASLANRAFSSMPQQTPNEPDGHEYPVANSAADENDDDLEENPDEVTISVEAEEDFSQRGWTEAPVHIGRDR